MRGGGECLIVVANGRVSSRSAPMRNFRTSHTNLRSACNANNNIIKKGEGDRSLRGEIEIKIEKAIANANADNKSAESSEAIR